MNRFLSCVILLTIATSLSGAATITDPHLTLSTYVSGLNQPTGFAFLGNNDLFAIEKTTGIVKHVVSGVATPVLDLNVENDTERGLLGITLSPNFSSDHHVYLYYSTTSRPNDFSTVGWTGNRLSMFTWNGTNLVNETPLFTIGTSPAGNGPNHDGGPIAFGPDGKLYSALGDLNRRQAEQNNTGSANTSSQVGGIYRLNSDGSIPSDNPFASNANTDFQKYFEYGLRNSFGMAFDPVTGALWDTENGDTTYDEINKVSSGMNSGWTTIMGPIARSGHSTSDLVNLPGSTYVDPKFSWLNTVAPTGIEFLARATDNPDYYNKAIVGDYNNGRLYMLPLNSARDGFDLSGSLSDLVADSDSELSSLIWGTGFNVPTQIAVGPDDALYVASAGNGTIYRISNLPEPIILPVIVPLLLVLARRRRLAGTC